MLTDKSYIASITSIESFSHTPQNIHGSTTVFLRKAEAERMRDRSSFSHIRLLPKPRCLNLSTNHKRHLPISIELTPL